jgi:hypothetical protein
LKDEFKPYFYWGMTALGVIGAAIGISFIALHARDIFSIVKKIASILTPIIYGAVLAFLMTGPYNFFVAFLNRHLKKAIKNQKLAKKISTGMATFLCVILVIAIISLLVMMILPQMISNVSDMLNSLPKDLASFEPSFLERFKHYPVVDKNYESVKLSVINWFNQSIVPNINKYIVGFSSGVITAFHMIINFLIGLMVMVYLLNMKEILAAQVKKICYSILEVKKANRLLEETRYIRKVFSQFIVGKIIDSLIIGIINYVFMLIIHMPYALLISVVVGVTNVIPFFGPFIGAIPSAFILLLVSPISCLEFLIWILILQQVDGNIIGPKILGQTTGLASFWVLFSILLFGGLFGIVGMVIGVPTWAVIYRLTKERVNIKLGKKKLSVDSKDYWGLQGIDEENGEYIREIKKD